MSENSGSSSGIGFGMVLFLIFMVLKLTGTIDWSWWWVTAPLWGAFVVVFGIVGVIIAIAAIGGVIRKW